MTTQVDQTFFVITSNSDAFLDYVRLQPDPPASFRYVSRRGILFLAQESDVVLLVGNWYDRKDAGEVSGVVIQMLHNGHNVMYTEDAFGDFYRLDPVQPIPTATTIG